jgi:hypothetical protein
MDKIKKLMDTLHISQEEAKEILECDRRIDKGEKLFELAGEAAKASKQARSVAREVGKPQTKRERQADVDKQEIIKWIFETLQEKNLSNVKITNDERFIELEKNGRKFKITLSAPRS